MHHCLTVIHGSAVSEPERISKNYFNSLVNSAWTALQNIKRPAKQCIPNHYAQNVSWTSDDYTALEVHTGAKKMDRVAVSHTKIRTTYMSLLASIRKQLRSMGINMIKYEDFKLLRESASTTHPGEGMATFNDVISHTEAFTEGKSREFRVQFLKEASHVYQMVIAAIHLCGGPSPRGTEQAVMRLLNSNSERMRNFQLMAHTIGVQNGYTKQRNYVESSSIQPIFVKYLPVPFAVLIASVILRVKPVEAEFARIETSANTSECSSFLLTEYGVPIDPLKMAAILSKYMKENGFHILLADLRHALEAFSHKFCRQGTGWIESFARGANHTLATSARYGRDQNSFVGIPADICMDNMDACNMWNVKVLHSPSMVHDEYLPQIYDQMKSLDLLSASDLSCLEKMQSAKELSSGERSQSGAAVAFQNVQDHVKQASDDSHEGGGEESSDKKEAKLLDLLSASDLSCLEKMQSAKELSSGERSQSGAAVAFQNVQDHVKQASDDSHEGGGEESSYKKEANCQYRPTTPLTQKAKQARTDQEIDDRRLGAKQIKRVKLLESLRPMQDQALKFLERVGASAFVVMPTGSGKTHLIWCHKKDNECAVIFAPYKVLVMQLQALCEEKGLTVLWPLDTFNGSPDAMLCNVQFALLPYEAAPLAHTFLKGLHRKGRLGPVWIDEVRFAASQGSTRSLTQNRYTLSVQGEDSEVVLMTFGIWGLIFRFLI